MSCDVYYTTEQITNDPLNPPASSHRIDFKNSVDFYGNPEWQIRHADRETGMLSLLAQHIGKQVGCAVNHCRMIRKISRRSHKTAKFHTLADTRPVAIDCGPDLRQNIQRTRPCSLFDLVEGVSVTDQVDEATGISSKVVIDWRSQPKGGELKPRISLTDAKGKVITLPNGMPANYYMSTDAILSVDNGQEVKAGDIIARIPRETSGTRDITGGLPRVAELFEARRPKDFAVISGIDGQVEFGKDYKSKRRIIVKPIESEGEAEEYLIPKGRHLAVHEGDFVRKGDPLLDGALVPHDILDIMGVEALADYLVNEIQDVYRLQGVKINDKHIEVIARQMLQKVEILKPGDTTFLVGEQVDREEFAKENQKYIERGKLPAEGKPVLQGITKASLQTRSFISAASFQETTRVLTEAAVNGKEDQLIGLKENVIVGRLIPAGTGAYVNQARRIAADRDREAIDAQQSDEALAHDALDDVAVDDVAETSEDGDGKEAAIG